MVSSSSTMAPPPRTTTRSLRLFKRWMSSHSIDFSNALLLMSTNDNSICVRALCRLTVGDLVAAIPKRACLTPRTTAANVLLERAELGGALALSFAVMYERAIGTESEWYGYLQIIPEREPVPLVWSGCEIDELLAGTELHKTVKEDRYLVYADWKEAIEPLVLSCPELNPDDFTAERYFSAKTLVSSRSFEVDDYHGFGMVPLADLFNHKTGAENVHFTATSSSSSSDNESNDDASGDDKSSILDLTTSSSGDDPEVLEMIIVRDVEAGDEVFNTYGTMGNAALLHRYGFTEPGNPYDIVNIDLKLVQKWCSRLFSNRYFRARMSLWRKLDYTGCNSQSSEYFEVTFYGEPQLELLVLLYIIFLDEQSYDKLKNIVDSFRKVDDDTKIMNLIQITMSRSYEGPRNATELLLTDMVCKALVGLADLRETLYGPTSLKDDVNRLSNCCPEKHRKLYHSLVLRVCERRTLDKLRSYASRQSKTKKRKTPTTPG